MPGRSWPFPPYRWVSGAQTVTPAEAFGFGGPAGRARFEAHPGLGYELCSRFRLISL